MTLLGLNQRLSQSSYTLMSSIIGDCHSGMSHKSCGFCHTLYRAQPTPPQGIKTFFPHWRKTVAQNNGGGLNCHLSVMSTRTTWGLRLSRVGWTQVPVNAVGFGNAFAHSENLPPKSLLCHSIVQAPFHKSCVAHLKHWIQEISRHRVSSASLSRRWDMGNWTQPK